MIQIPFELPLFEPGSVWLTGAGPGEPGLLSVLALHGLQNADIVVHDALVPAELLQARPTLNDPIQVYWQDGPLLGLSAPQRGVALDPGASGNPLALKL